MAFDSAQLAVLVGLAILSNRIVEALVTPVFNFYGWNKFPLLYISWLAAGALVFASGINLFAAFIPNPIVGKLLTAIAAGGGGNILHDVTDQQSKVVIANIPADADEDIPLDQVQIVKDIIK